MIATTEEGRWITVFMLVVGVALFGAMTAVLVSYFVSGMGGSDEVDELRSLTRMRNERLVTPEEYETTKRAILDELVSREPRSDRWPPAG